ncbi:MAG: hypothetical protein ACI4O7_02495 [Aristaeellaceae bacterium]
MKRKRGKIPSDNPTPCAKTLKLYNVILCILRITTWVLLFWTFRNVAQLLFTRLF